MIKPFGCTKQFRISQFRSVYLMVTIARHVFINIFQHFSGVKICYGLREKMDFLETPKSLKLWKQLQNSDRGSFNDQRVIIVFTYIYMFRIYHLNVLNFQNVTVAWLTICPGMWLAQGNLISLDLPYLCITTYLRVRAFFHKTVSGLPRFTATLKLVSRVGLP